MVWRNGLKAFDDKSTFADIYNNSDIFFTQQGTVPGMWDAAVQVTDYNGSGKFATDAKVSEDASGNPVISYYLNKTDDPLGLRALLTAEELSEIGQSTPNNQNNNEIITAEDNKTDDAPQDNNVLTADQNDQSDPTVNNEQEIVEGQNSDDQSVPAAVGNDDQTDLNNQNADLNDNDAQDNIEGQNRNIPSALAEAPGEDEPTDVQNIDDNPIVNDQENIEGQNDEDPNKKAVLENANQVEEDQNRNVSLNNDSNNVTEHSNDDSDTHKVFLATRDENGNWVNDEQFEVNGSINNLESAYFLGGQCLVVSYDYLDDNNNKVSKIELWKNKEKIWERNNAKNASFVKSGTQFVTLTWYEGGKLFGMDNVSIESISQLTPDDLKIPSSD